MKDNETACSPPTMNQHRASTAISMSVLRCCSLSIAQIKDRDKECVRGEAFMFAGDNPGPASGTVCPVVLQDFVTEIPYCCFPLNRTFFCSSKFNNDWRN